MSKSYSDFERDYIKVVSNITINEMINELYSDDDFIPSEDRYSFISMQDAVIKIKDNFYRRMMKNDEFLDLPIFAIAYDENEDCYKLALEEASNGYHITLNVRGCSISSSFMLMSAYESIHLNYKTIRDFVNNPPEGVDMSDYK